MQTRVASYREELKTLAGDQWESFLSANSRLPGPRANLELAQACGEEASAGLVSRTAGSPDEFLAMCGAIGLGRLAAQARNPIGNPTGNPIGKSLGGLERLESDLAALASDVRWRVREGVAMALQRLGDEQPQTLVRLVRRWVKQPDWLLQRAAVAGICEPRLLERRQTAIAALATVTRATRNLAGASPEQRSEPALAVLRKALGYCWSVVIAANPGEGFDGFEVWADSSRSDVRWIVESNLNKKRLQAADPDRYARLRDRFELVES